METNTTKYWSVDGEVLSLHCYNCDTGISFSGGNELQNSTCPVCLTLMFLPSELELA